MSSAPESAVNPAAKSLREQLRRRARVWLAPVLAYALAAAAGCATIQNPTVTEPSAALSSDANTNPNSLLKSARGHMPLYFIENRGQVDARASYYLRGKDKTLYFTAEGITFILNRARHEGAETMLVRTALQSAAQSGPIDRWALKLDFVGANRVAPRGEEPTPAVISYFKGPKDEWKTGLKSYGKLVYADLWPGIDLVYGGTADRIKYMFVVKPGADVSRIQLAYRGASISVNEQQELEIATPMGSFHDDKPYAYQEIADKRVEVPMAYLLQPEAGEKTGRYGFRVGGYDREQPLVLDPAILVYAGFIGGLLDDRGNGVAVDSDGAVYVAGETSSDETTFPDGTGFGPIPGKDKIQNGGVDAFVAKVKADGTGLEYATFIGGSGDDRGNAIALEQGCAPPCAAYITGETSSDETNFPVTTGAFDTTQNGGIDAFVAKLSADGTSLIYVTYIGGAGDDRGKGIAVDSSGEAYVTGETTSTEATFPGNIGGLAALGIPGPDQTQNSGFDAFVVKLNLAGTALIYATYVGGNSDDRGNAIAIESGCAPPCAAYIAGETSSTQTTFPVAVGPDLTHNGGIDAFVAKVNSGGTALVYAGYIGGSGTDQANGIAVDGLGNAYVAGETSSTEASFPDGTGFFALGIPGPDQTQNGGIDAFVAKVNPAGSALVYAGYIGGVNDDRANAIAIEPGCAPPCEAYVTGETNSDQTTFPDSVGPGLTFNGGVDAFVAKVKASGTGLVLAGYIGGSGDDRGNAIAVDDNGGVYVAGETSSTENSTPSKFPVKTGPDLTQNGGVDAFVAKICTAGCVDLTLKKTGLPTTVLPGPGPAGTVTYTLVVSNKGPDTAHNVTVTDPLPAGATFIPPAVSVPPGAICTVVAPVVCNVGTMIKGSSVTLTIVTRAPAFLGTIANTATVEADETDTKPSNNTATAKTKVILPDLVISKLTLDKSTVHAAGDTINVTDTTANKQAVSTNGVASTTSFYLSIDKIFDVGDAPALASRPVVALGPKGSDPAGAPTPLTIPAMSIGTVFYIIAVADDGNLIDETPKEGNNTKVSKKITITP